MEEAHVRKGLSLVETPTWAVATVIFIMVCLGFFFNASLKQFGKWLHRTKRNSLFAALEKIKEELMLFGVLSLLLGHWIVYVAKICVKTSDLNDTFYPCAARLAVIEHLHVSYSDYLNNKTVFREQTNTTWQQHHHPNTTWQQHHHPHHHPNTTWQQHHHPHHHPNTTWQQHHHNHHPRRRHHYCPEGKESFASYESMEQLHRFVFTLGVTHVTYSFVAIALAMIKIYSWTTWENQAKFVAIQASRDTRMRRLTTFISHRTSHPWSQHKFLVWLLCFSRQFWSSINHADYVALRLGFITARELPLSYDFHKYMLRSMEEEFGDIVGISIPLWMYAIFCIFLNFHGTDTYFWLSFLPAILILLIGTKLHRIVVKLAVEIMDQCPGMGVGHHQFKLRDELFWFGNPRLLLRLIQLISFQNALEMATFLWSLWEIKEPSCFMENRIYLVIRLTFGVTTQCWCSFITFPLYVIIAQMGSKFKSTVVSDNVRKSLHGWRGRVKAKRPYLALVSAASATSLESMLEDETNKFKRSTSSNMEGSSSRYEDTSIPHYQSTSVDQIQAFDEQSPRDEVPLFSGPVYNNYEDEEYDHKTNNV